MHSLVVIVFFLCLNAFGAPAPCDPNRCFSRQTPEVQQQVLDGASVIQTARDPATPYEQVYALRRIRGADPELVAGMFATLEELRLKVPAITEAEVVRRAPGVAVIRYELDVRRLLGPEAGALVSKAPISRYAVINHYERRTDGSYLIWWELEAAETARLNPRKGLLGGIVGNLGEPEHVHGYMLVEPIAGTRDAVLSYASYAVPKSAMARAAAGVVNQTAKATLLAIVERVAGWTEAVAAQAPETQQKYRARICELLLKTP